MSITRSKCDSQACKCNPDQDSMRQASYLRFCLAVLLGLISTACSVSVTTTVLNLQAHMCTNPCNSSGTAFCRSLAVPLAGACMRAFAKHAYTGDAISNLQYRCVAMIASTGVFISTACLVRLPRQQSQHCTLTTAISSINSTW